MKRKYLMSIVPAIALLSLLLAPLQVKGAWVAGTAGEVSLGTYQVADSTPVTIQLTGLTSSAGFALNIIHKTTEWINFTTGSSQDTAYYTVVLEKPSTSTQVTIILYGATGNADASATSLSEAVVYIYEAPSLIPTGFFLPVAVALIVIGLLISIAVGLVYIGKRRGG